MAEFWALRYSGRFIVTVATGPTTSYLTTSSVMGTSQSNCLLG